MASTTGTRNLNVTFVTVCLEPEVLGAALDASERCGWVLQEAHFDTPISARRRPHFGSHLRAGDGCVALVDFDGDPGAAIEATLYLTQVFGERLVVVAISNDSRPQAILTAMRAGCAEFLVKPVDSTAFDEAFGRVMEHFAAHNTVSQAAGAVLAFFGAKGGVGSTTLAVHLAAFLVQNNHKKVLLIDNHVQFGHVCVYLGIDGSEFHFQELVRNVSRLDSELLRGFIATHASGLDVLSSPDLGKAARPMHPDDVASTLEFLRGEYDLVVVDCRAVIDDVNRAVIAAATQVYVVATPEISAIRDLSRYVDELVHLSDTKDKVRVVLNRYSSQFAIGLETVEKAIRLPVTSCIPNNYVELVRSANLGVPVAADSRSEFSLGIQRWANALAGDPDTAPVEEAAPKHAGTWKALRNTLSGLLSTSPVPDRKGA